MQIRMQNAVGLTQAQIQEFLKGSRAVEFGGQNRAEHRQEGVVEVAAYRRRRFPQK